MHKARTVRTLLLAAGLSLACTAPARALTQAEEAGFAVIATGANLFWVPAKLLVAAAAIPVGGLAGAFSGGDARTAYAIWVPAMGGTFFLTNSHLDGSKPIEFLGSDYPDRPDRDIQKGQRTIIFDQPYESLYH
jgi:hypothetical protein